MTSYEGCGGLGIQECLTLWQELKEVSVVYILQIQPEEWVAALIGFCESALLASGKGCSDV